VAVRKQVARGKRGVRRAARVVREQAVRAGGQASKATALPTGRIQRGAPRTVRWPAREFRDGPGSLVGVVPPHLCFSEPRRPWAVVMQDTLRIATYNVHRWQRRNGRADPDVAGRLRDLGLDADVIALREVLRPFPRRPGRLRGPRRRADRWDFSATARLHLAFAITRQHRRGQLSNASSPASRSPRSPSSTSPTPASSAAARSPPTSATSTRGSVSSRPISPSSTARATARSSRCSSTRR
jgi:hypothetical protein